MRLGVVQDLVMDGLEPEVAAAFESALRRLSAAGARIERVAFAELHALPRINAAGGLIAAEAWQVHRARLVDASVAARYDPRVAQRTRRGEAILAADYIDVQDARARLQAAAQERLGHLDAWLMPTVAVRAPLREPLERDDAHFFATNALVLRNTSVINFLDGCALSLPCGAPGELPVGLSVAGRRGCRWGCRWRGCTARMRASCRWAAPWRPACARADGLRVAARLRPGPAAAAARGRWTSARPAPAPA